MTSRPVVEHYHQGTHAGCDTTNLPLRVRNGGIYCGVCNGRLATANTTVRQLLESIPMHLQAKIESEGTGEDNPAWGPNMIGRRIGRPKVIELKSCQ